MGSPVSAASGATVRARTASFTSTEAQSKSIFSPSSQMSAYDVLRQRKRWLISSLSRCASACTSSAIGAAGPIVLRTTSPHAPIVVNPLRAIPLITAFRLPFKTP